jgi:hypothetical protein
MNAGAYSQFVPSCRLDAPSTDVDARRFIPPGVSTPGARPPRRGLCFFPDLNEVLAASAFM